MHMPRGRPKKDKVVQLVPKRRGRPPKYNGENTSALVPVNPAQPTMSIIDERPLPVQRQVFADVQDKRGFNDEERAAVMETFLQVYPSVGGRIDEACTMAGVNARTIYKWLDKYEDFRQRFDDAKRLVIGLFESRLVQIAMDDDHKANFTATMAILNAECPEKYRPRSTVDMNVRVMADYKGFANRDGEGAS
jgi:transposase